METSSSAVVVNSLWEKALSYTAALRRAEISDAEALFLGGLVLARDGRSVVTAYFECCEIPSPTIAAETDCADIKAALGFTFERAETTIRKFKLTDNEAGALACLVLTAFAELPVDTRRKYGVDEPVDQVWVQTKLKETIGRMPGGTAELRRKEGAVSFPFDKLPVVDMVARAGRPLHLPTLDRNVEAVLMAARRRRRRCIALLGAQEVGKTFTMEQVAARIKHQEVPDEFRQTTVLMVDLATIISPQIGETAKQLRDVFSAAGKLARAILFVDEFQGLVSGGRSRDYQTDVTAVLKTMLTSDDYPNLTVVVATTSREWTMFIGTDPAMARRFSPVRISPPSSEEELESLRVQSREFLGGDVAITDELLKRALQFQREYQPERVAVNAALDILDDALAEYRTVGGKKTIEECFAAACKRQTGANLRGPVESDSSELMLEILKERVVGQPHVIERLVESFEQSLLGLGRRRGPKNVILFAGPPGTGKTSAARAYAECVGRENFLQLDMGQYKDAHEAIIKLIGSGPSYHNAEVGGALTNFVRDHPDAVVVFDEIDRPDPAVKDSLFQILEEGACRDGFGRLVDFRNTTLFFTTNAGAFHRGDTVPLGFADTESSGTATTDLTHEDILVRLSKHFDPAFLSRIHTAVVFQPLSRIALAEIALQQIREDADALRELTGMTLQVNDEIGDILVAVSKADDDARQIRHTLSRKFWPQLTRYVIQSKPRWGELRKLRIEADCVEAARTLRVLLLDDEADREMVNIALPDTDITPYASAHDAAERIGGHDVVLLDLNWGHGAQDGIGILKSIRRKDKEVPVILYTHETAHEMRLSYYRAGAVGFVAKKQPEQLRLALQRIRREFSIRDLPVVKNLDLEWEASFPSRDEMVITLSLAGG